MVLDWAERAAALSPCSNLVPYCEDGCLQQAPEGRLRCIHSHASRPIMWISSDVPSVPERWKTSQALTCSRHSTLSLVVAHRFGPKRILLLYADDTRQGCSGIPTFFVRHHTCEDSCPPVIHQPRPANIASWCWCDLSRSAALRK